MEVSGSIPLMDDPRLLRIITIGLVLAALAVGYFLLTGGLTSRSKKVQTNQVNRVVESPVPSPASGVSGSPQTATESAYSRILDRTQTGVRTLPDTGFPAGLAIVFSISAMISGLSLRKFPK